MCENLSKAIKSNLFSVRLFDRDQDEKNLVHFNFYFDLLSILLK